MVNIVTLGAQIETTGSARAKQQVDQYGKTVLQAAAATDSLEDNTRQLSNAQRAGVSANNRYATSLQRTTAASRSSAFAVQNAAFQLQDIFTQVTLGVPVMRTLGIQLPQLLGGFGAIGAVIGVAVSALAIFTTGTKDATTEIEKLEEAFSNLGAARGDISGIISQMDALVDVTRDARTETNLLAADIISNSEREFNARSTLLRLRAVEIQRDIDAQSEALATATAELRVAEETARLREAAQGPRAASGLYSEESLAAIGSGGSTTAKVNEELRQAQNLVDRVDASRELAFISLQEIQEFTNKTFDELVAEAGTRAETSISASNQRANREAAAAALLMQQVEAGTITVTEAAIAYEGMNDQLNNVNQDIKTLDETFAEFSALSNSINNDLLSAFNAVVGGTKTAGDAIMDFVDNVLLQVANKLFEQQFGGTISDALAGAIGGALGGGGGKAAVKANANGNAFSGGSIMPFANGGVVNSTTMFPMKSGIGMMGEAGPEAILPLQRGSDGKLGVSAASGGAQVNVTVINENKEVQTDVQQTGPNDIKIISRLVAADINRGGAVFQSINRTFDTNPKLAGR